MSKPLEKRLLALFRQLPGAQAEQLVEFAEYLAVRHPAPAPAAEPLSIPRPADESVIKAIKRLSATYPMLDPGKMLDAASSLVSQHVIQGRAAAEVIDELEAMFQRQYEQLRSTDPH